MLRHIAEDTHLVATGTGGLGHEKGVIEGPGRTDQFPGRNTFDRIQGQTLPRLAEVEKRRAFLEIA